MWRYNMNRKRKSQAGVTLIEMLVVVTIIGLFIALVGPKLWANVDKAKITKARAELEGLQNALGTYKLDNGNFPTSEQGLQALRVKPADAVRWSGPYTEKDIPKDPWGARLRVQIPG